MTRWLVELPGQSETFVVTTPLVDQEMPRTGVTDIPPAYWEGAVDVVRTGSDGRQTRGMGYSEHMPYEQPRVRRHR